jgi:hypothetical protein
MQIYQALGRARSRARIGGQSDLGGVDFGPFLNERSALPGQFLMLFLVKISAERARTRRRRRTDRDARATRITG